MRILPLSYMSDSEMILVKVKSIELDSLTFLIGF